MDMFRLQCFVALAEELHFHRAADRCHISQPAMSQQIAKLEDELRVKLAIRSKRSVSLTRAGEVFLREARKTLRQMDLAVSLTRRTNRGEIGQITVGVTAPAMYIVFPEIVREFAARSPDVGVVVHEMSTLEQEAALRDGRIDVGVLHPPLQDDSLGCHIIGQPPYLAVLPAGHRLALKARIRLADLAGDDFILFPRAIGPQLYDSIIGLCQEAGFSPRVVQEAFPAQTIIAFAAAGMGVGFIASRVQRLERVGTIYREFEGPRPSLTLGVAALTSNLAMPVVAEFIDAATKAGSAVQ